MTSQDTKYPRAVSRGSNAHSLVNLAIDSLYLVVEYPHTDLYHRWATSVPDPTDPRLFEGLPVGNMLVRRGAHGYKLSVWQGGERLFLTDRVEDTLVDSSQAGQGMGALLVLSPEWLQQFGEPFAPNTLRKNVAAQLALFGLENALDYPIRINRLDLALDLKGLAVNTFNTEHWRRGWVGFAHPRDFHLAHRSRELTGLTIGSRTANVRLVVYDKVRDAKRLNKLGFWRSVWRVPDEEEHLDVTRFEWSFRCYKARFTRMRYLADYSFEGFLGLLNYATQSWGCLRIPGDSPHNKQRWDLDPLWAEILAHVDDWSIHYDQIVKPELHLKPDTNEAYLRAFVGWTAGLQARLGIAKDKDKAASLAETLSFLHNEGYDVGKIQAKADYKHGIFRRLLGGKK